MFGRPTVQAVEPMAVSGEAIAFFLVSTVLTG
jgi:hypothetical protein